MHKKAIDALIDQAKNIAEELVYIGPVPHKGQKIVGGEHPASSYTLTEKGDEMLHKLLDETLLKKYRWSDRFSREYLEDRFQQLMFIVLQTRDTTPIGPGIHQLVNDYDSFNLEYQVIIPLIGVRLAASPIQLGRVTLRRFDEAASKDVIERCRSIFMENHHYTEERKAQYFDEFKREHISKVQNYTCAEIVVKAESTRAREVALDETRLALDLVRYAILFLHSDKRPRPVGLLGDVPEQSRATLAIRTDNQEVNVFESMTNFTFDINQHTITKMDFIGVFTLSEIIKNYNRSEFESVILRAVHWLASAQTQNGNENILLNLVTCLETFFKVDRGLPITANIAEGVALLTTSEAEARRQRKKRITELYDQRSTLTHEGEANITSDDLRDLTIIARDLILVMIRHKDKFAGHKAFKDWLEGQKMNATICFPDEKFLN